MSKNTKKSLIKTEKTTQNKKSNKRSKSKHPYLKKNLNTKARRDYIDNINYINGVISVNDPNVKGIRALNEEELDFLNKFNKEFYGASFSENDNENLHKDVGNSQQIEKVRTKIKKIKSKLKTSISRNKKNTLVKELEFYQDELLSLYPKKKCTDANNSRNRCLLNIGKLTNQVKLIPWNARHQDKFDEMIDQDSYFNEKVFYDIDKEDKKDLESD